jgi:hypothetical protein
MVPAAFRLKVSPVTSSVSLQRWSIVEILRYVLQRTCVSAQSIPANHIGISLFPARTSWASRVLISGCSKHDPLIVDVARKAAQGSTIFLRRSSRVEVQGFPRQFLQGKAFPCRPLVERA